MKYIVFYIISIFLVQSGVCQSIPRYQCIDEYVSSFTSSAETPEKLAHALIKKKWTEDEKVRAIYGWIAKNIRYDYEAFNLGKIKFSDDNTMAMEAFVNRRGVCSNYAALFKHMCNCVGIEAKIVSGYIRLFPWDAGKSVTETDRHAWNIVKTNGKYHLIESTWASADSAHFNYYFYPDPKRFIATHFSKEQLLNFPIKKEEFDKYPFILDRFFFNKQDNIFPKQGIIRTNDGYVVLKINYPDSLSLTPFFFVKDSLYYPSYNFKKNGQTLTLSLRIIEGEHILRLGDILAYRVIYKKEE